MKYALIVTTFILGGCSVVATRPTQDMFNADAALKAAKVMHADTLSPEFFRLANENYYKAKREYRAKNFDAAKRFAIRTIKLAEKSEFDAYIKGGANPEVAASQTSFEGASGDPEVALKKAHELREQKDAEEQRALQEKLKQQEMEAAEQRAKERAKEPSLPAEGATTDASGTEPKKDTGGGMK